MDDPEFPRVSVVGARLQDSPVDGDTLSVNVTVPKYPFWALTEIVDEALTPAWAMTLAEFATTAKSWIV